MARAFTDADLLQSPAGGTSAGATGVTVTLPSGATEGSCGVIFLHTEAPADPPSEWDNRFSEASGRTAVMFRPHLMANESSWMFDWHAAAATWAWKAQEWANVAWKGPAGVAIAPAGGLAPTSVATGDTGTWAEEYVIGLLVVSLYNPTGGSATWPTASFSNSFTETDMVSVGSGTGAGNIGLWAARRYGTQNETGPWSCTASFTGATNGMLAAAVLVVLGAM
jgi:hypothetical protein